MECSKYRALYQEGTYSRLPFDFEETEEHEAYVQHGTDCADCGEWIQGMQVQERGFNVSDFPCVHIAHAATFRCEQHPDPWDCPDHLIIHLPNFNEYGIPVRDGGTSLAVITHCPWCGIPLPASRREELCTLLEEMGFEDGTFSEGLPPKYTSDAWWRGYSIWTD